MGVDYIFYNTLIKYILKHKPKFILELGSGYTTYLMGTLIQDYNLDTKLLSLENEKKWYDWIKNEKLDVLDSVVMSDIEAWEEDGEVFVKYIYDYNMDEVDFVLLDGPGHFEYNGKIIKNSIQYNYYELISYRNSPVNLLIDGRELTKKFYKSEFKKRGWNDTHIKFQESILVNKIYKNSGVKYWKECFNDLKSMDAISLDGLLTRFKNTILTFPKYNLEKSGSFFIPIQKESDLEEEPELKKLHEKFNSKNVEFPIGSKNPKRICFRAYGNSPYRRSYYGKGTLTKNSHQDWKDGMIRPGLNLAANNWKSIASDIRYGKVTKKFIYIEIPYDLILEYMDINHNGHEMKIPKQFVNEVESTNDSWDNDDEVNKLIDLYDDKYPDWNYDFPIFGYTTFIKYGMLMPVFYFGNKIFKNGTHRIYNACLAKSDIPIFLNIPSKTPDSKFKKFIINDDEFIVYSAKIFKKIGGEYSRLVINVNLNDRSLKYYLAKSKTKIDNWIVVGRDPDVKSIGQSEF